MIVFGGIAAHACRTDQDTLFIDNRHFPEKRDQVHRSDVRC